jgi:hypothetical protein
MVLPLPSLRHVRIRARIRIPDTLAASIPRVRRLQAPDPDHIRPDSAQRTHLLPDPAGTIPDCLLGPFHAARRSCFATAALRRGRYAAGFDVRPDLVGEGGDELGGDG